MSDRVLQLMHGALKSEGFLQKMLAAWSSETAQASLRINMRNEIDAPDAPKVHWWDALGKTMLDIVTKVADTHDAVRLCECVRKPRRGVGSSASTSTARATGRATSPAGVRMLSVAASELADIGEWAVFSACKVGELVVGAVKTSDVRLAAASGVAAPASAAGGCDGA